MASVIVNTPVRTIELFGSAYDAAARTDIAALQARAITGTGLASGGGDLSADRVITVLKASGADSVAGIADDRAVTPAALATPLGQINDALASLAPLVSPILTGVPQAPQAALGTSTFQIATTSFVAAAVEDAAGDGSALAAHLADTDNPHAVDKADVGLADVVNLAPADLPVSSAAQIALNLKAPIASPSFTGAPLAPTAAPGTDTTQIATTAFVNVVAGGIDLKAPIASPSFTGVPIAPTAAPGTDTTQIATTAFVKAVADDIALEIDAKSDTNSPVFTGIPQAPQAALGTATDQIATTGFVAAALVTSGDVAADLALHLADTDNPHVVTKSDVGLSNVSNLAPADLPVSSAAQTALNLKANTASPSFTGVPIAPTAAPGTDTTQIATTAFVGSAIQDLSASDLALLAPLASPVFTGVPQAPQAALGTDTDQVATAGFVAAALEATVDVVAADLALHLADTDNPHAVAKSDVGLSNVSNLAPADLPVSTATQAAVNAVAADIADVAADLALHLADTDNPHAVTKADVGLADVVNLAPADLPVSSAAQIAVNAVAADVADVAADLATHAGDTSNPHAVDKADVGLSNVSNLAPADLPVSSAAQTALNLKSNAASPSFTGVPTAPTAAPGTDTTQIATTAFVAVIGADADAAQAAADAAQADADAAQAAADAAQAAADVAAADAAQAVLNSVFTPDLIGRRQERPGDSETLFGLVPVGEPTAMTGVDPAWAIVTSAGRVLRITADPLTDPRLVAPRGVFPVEADIGWTVRWKVQRIVDPEDPLNDSVSLRVEWLDQNKSSIAQSTIENLPLVVADGIQERRAFLATGMEFEPPVGAVYFRPCVALFGGDHITDIIVIEARQTAALAGPLYLPMLDADPVTAPGTSRVALYAVRNLDGTANLRIQGGTSIAALDIIVNFGGDDDAPPPAEPYGLFLFTPASGDTVEITESGKVVLNQAAPLATLTLSIVDSFDQFQVSTRQRIDELTITSSIGASVDWETGELPKDGVLNFTFVESINTWVRG